MLGLAAIAALAAMAYVGASTASADWLCEENLAHTQTCPDAKKVAVNAKIVGLSINANLETGKLSATLLDGESEPLMRCNSKVLGKFLGQESVAGEHKPILGLIETMNFEHCEGPCKKANQDEPALLLAIAAQLKAWVEPDPTALPGAWLEECTFLNFKCLYRVQTHLEPMTVSGDELIADKIKLLMTSKTFSCEEFFPEEGFWDATYLLTLDTAGHNEPIYLTLLP
jgi:hypothetical protein